MVKLLTYCLTIIWSFTVCIILKIFGNINKKLAKNSKKIKKFLG